MFGQLVAAQRRRLSLTQEELAHRTGLAARSLRDLEADRVRRPRPTTVRLLADAFGLSGPARDEFVAAAAGAAGGAPPSPARDPLAARPRQLPLDVPGFAGREEAMSALHRLLDATVDDDAPRTVVISAVSGTPGVGKTTLAVHWARQVADRFADGQLYVNLRGFDHAGSILSPDDALRGFLEALGVRAERIPVGTQARSALYRSLLADRCVLVVLDNARDAEQVRPLLPGSPGCLVVVTSRNRLTGLVAREGAQPLMLDPLAEEESRELLRLRIGADRIAAEPQAVTEIIDGCARLPLALVIAAARAATRTTMSLGALAADLRGTRRSLTALAAGDPTADVRVAFASSYDALGDDARLAFRRLGLHPGPDLSLATAAALMGRSRTEAAALLAELTEAHLVTEQAPGRYGFHDLLRSYAAELAEGEDSDVVRRAARVRLVDHSLRNAHAAALLLQPQWAPVTLPDDISEGEVEGVADRGQALGWFTAEHPALLGVTRLAGETGLDRQAWRLAWTLATFYAPQGMWQPQLESQLLALESARRSGEPAGQAVAHRLLARAYTRLGRHDDAQLHLEAALDTFRAQADPAGQAQTLHNLAELAMVRGDLPGALAQADQSLQLWREASDRGGEGRALNAVGWCHAMLGNHEQALDHCRRALQLQQQIDDRNGMAATADSLGHVHHELGEYREAAAALQQAIELFRETADRYNEATTLARLGDSYLALDDALAADAAFREAIAILDELGDPAAERVRAKLPDRRDPPIRSASPGQ